MRNRRGLFLIFRFIGNSDFKELKENKSSPNMC